MGIRSTHKQYTQSQLTKIFASVSQTTPQSLKYRIWFNPTDDNSLRLSLEGYRFVVQTMKYQSYEFGLDRPITNRNLLKLERYFRTMYYLLEGSKIIIFDENEASMLALQGDIMSYLDNLELTEQID